ncbi:RsbT co-antagonist protein RsbRD [Thalassobacillus devorans]|uniref:RsbT co-antagonist protein RsbRD n=1 Tax=Thalassobacillus devorans TaxID=279813 RepID=A0ABQ1NJX9_9BACI|nr:STAS domain-containing protein [Thalassobacillus devorans]NIK27601.1 rsbT co-antagonist protein RsbR [Thalassobacillus devorans]GGC79030.1 RsbT co-antagonist protein RsbRD [Thalassobacillus devorans]
MIDRQNGVRELISEKVISQKSQLRENLRLHKEDYQGNIANNAEDLVQWRGDLIELYAETIVLDLEESDKKVTEWGDKASDFLVNIQMPLDLAIEEIRYYRNMIGEIIRDTGEKESLPIRDFYDLVSSFDLVVDQVVEIISVSYMKKYNQKMYASQTEINELSVPIIEITESVAVLPLVGAIDTARAQLLMDHALSESSNNDYDYFIIDVSGVPVIDTMVADQIFKVIRGLKLIGVEVKMSGVRPEIAQTMVQLGVDFEDTLSFSSLHRALDYIGFGLK